MRSLALLCAFLTLTLAACSTAPRTVDKPVRPGTITPPTEEVETEEEGDPDVEDAPVQEVPVLPDSTQRWSGLAGDAQFAGAASVR